MNYSSLHVHSHYSNPSVQFCDSINSVSQIVERAQQLGLHGVALTDHEILAGHVEMYRLQEKYPDMKLILGNEIYCMTQEQMQGKMNGDDPTPYYHLLLLALDLEGWRQLCKLSTFAWKNSFNRRGSLRRITTKEYLHEVISENPGHIVCCSACMGGEISKLLMADNTREAEQVVRWCQNLFGEDNYFLEIQPNDKDTHQWESNKRVITLAKKLKVPLIATTDAHMLDVTEKAAHAAAKNSKFSEDSEGEDFYATAYLMDDQTLIGYLRNNLTDKEIVRVLNNTNKIADRVIGYDGILKNQIIPEIPKEYIPEFNIQHLFKEYYEEYEYFKMFSQKTYLQEAYAFYQIEQGLYKRIIQTDKKDRLEEYIARIDHELEIVSAIDENLGTKIITYYSTYTFMMDEIWKLGSVVAVGRGSACSWLINYIMGANQIDPLDAPMKEMLFPERHLNKLRFELPDCDYDSSPMYRQKIVNRFREIWGEDQFLQVATYGTLKPKAAIKRACKGLGIEDEIADSMAMMIPIERGNPRPLSICLDKNSTGKVSELITEVDKHKGLREILLRLEGLIVSMGSHAGGVCFYNEPYVEELPAVKSPKGVMQTCFDLHDAEATGTTKFDNLTTTATELIRKELELLVRDGYIEDKGNLRDNYESVIGIENLEYEDSQMWEKILRVPQLFEFETPIGVAIIKKMQPKSIEELCAASSLMRLLPQGMTELPANRYLRYKDVEKFRKDATRYGLNEEEIALIEKVCKPDGYMTLHQETLMLMSMEVAGFTYKEANKLRKSVAGKNAQAQQEMKEMFFEWCANKGTREIFANYVWNEMFAAQLGYSST